MHFQITRKDSEILSEFLDKFQDGDGEICNKIIANAMAAVFLARPDGDPFNKSKASKVRKSENGFIIAMTGWRDNMLSSSEDGPQEMLIYHMCRDEVMTEVEEMSGDLPGSCVFMGSLQDTTTKLGKNIPDEERLNGQFCQRKNFRCVVLTAHKHEDKPVTATLFEADKPNDTQQLFLSFCPDWKNAPLFKEWQNYAKKCYNADNVQNALKDCSTTNKMQIHIPIKADGRPKVPNITLNDSYKTKTVQVMLCEYLTTHIQILGYVSGKQRARISWGELSTKPSTWINPERSLIGFTWANLLKIRIEMCPVLKDATLSSEECQDYCSDRCSDDNSGHSAAHGSKNTTHTSEEPQESSTSSVTPSEFNFYKEWGRLNVDSQMNSLRIGPTHLTEEHLEPLQYNRTPTESIVGSGSDRGGPLSSPLEFGLRLNTSGKDDTRSYNSEGNQSLLEEPVEISDLPKHKIKLTEKAR
ncbi:hypothetical protein V8E53_000755 [Lactarius tabidus]